MPLLRLGIAYIKINKLLKTQQKVTVSPCFSQCHFDGLDGMPLNQRDTVDLHE